MVRDIRVPSSSSSNSAESQFNIRSQKAGIWTARTNCDGLDADSFFDVSVGGIIGVLALEDLLSAESVDERGAT